MTFLHRILFSSLAPALACAAPTSWWTPLPAARNVIVLIPAGCSQSLVTLARCCRGAPLAVDAIQVGVVKTASADSLVTDSAAAATALACGVKTGNGVLGSAPDADAAFRPADLPDAPGQPLATVLEAAKHSGRSVGMVVSASVTDATPAGFAAHTLARQADSDIMKQLVYQDLDVVLGGGRQWLLPQAEGGLRTDRANLLAVLQARGTQVVADRAALAQVTGGRVWGLFAPGALAAAIDRAVTAPDQPTLAEMTARAITLLQQNPRGFFLLVAGSQVDKGDRANDTAQAVHEFLAFDDAVREALAFTETAGRGRTLVVACPDHDTGGLTIGRLERTPRLLADLTGPLAGMRESSETLVARLGDDASPPTIQANVRAWWNIRLTDAEAVAISNRAAGGLTLNQALNETVARGHSALGWTTFGQTGVDVPLWSAGPGRPMGVLNNTAVAGVIARALRVDLPGLTRTLYVDAQQAFPQAKLDAADPANAVLVVSAARLPVNENRLLWGVREIRLEGLVVHQAATGRTYLPQQAVDWIRAHPGASGAARP